MTRKRNTEQCVQDSAQPEDADIIDSSLARFETAWRRTKRPPSIGTYFADCKPLAASQAATLLRELVLVDMEYRWRRGAEGEVLPDALGTQPRLDDYADVYQQLGPLHSLPDSMLAEEYRVRQVWGDRTNHDHFFARFPDRRATLLPRLREVDRDLEADSVPSAGSSGWAADAHALPDARAPLLHSDFVLEQHLGTGGMGKVYRALQKSLGRRVAVKALLKSRQRDAVAVERCLQEGKVLARLRHPNIVGVHGLGRFPGGGYFLVLDLVEGDDLAKLIARGPLEPAEAVRISRAVADAVEYAHRQGILHCDLTPANVLLDASGHVYVADFGLAQFLPSAGEPPEPIEVWGGTWGFMAPEQLQNSSGALGPTTDVYGMGALLYATITGQPPVAVRERGSAGNDSTSDTAPKRPTSLRAGIPEWLDFVCLKCLANDPAERFRSASEVAEQLGSART